MIDTPSTTDDTTNASEDANALIDAASAIMRPVTAAIRQRANGREVDIHAALATSKTMLRELESQIAGPAQAERRQETYTPLDLMSGYWDALAKKKGTVGTGFASLDKALSGGLEADRLVVLLGAPGSGKTTFVNQIANHAGDSGRAVLYVTSEDLPITLLAKTITRRGNIEYSAVQRGYPTHKEQINAAFEDYKQALSARLVRYLDATSGTTLDTIAEQAVQHFSACKDATTGSPIIVVDYLQRLARREGLGTDLRSSITAYTENLRSMACDLHCTVILLCAMNRASNYQTGASTIASAKESGDIDYTADVIMAIGEDSQASEPAPNIRRWMLRIDKNRQGSVTFDQSHIALDWYASRQQFTEAMKDEDVLADIEKAYGEKPSNGRRGRR